MYMYLVPVICISKQATSTTQDIQTYMTIFSSHQFQVPPDDDFKCFMLESVGKEMDYTSFFGPKKPILTCIQ